MINLPTFELPRPEASPAASPRAHASWQFEQRVAGGCLVRPPPIFKRNAKHSASKMGQSSKQMINRALRVAPLTSMSLLTGNNGGPPGQRFKDFLIKVTQTWGCVLQEKKLCLSLKCWQVNNPFSNGPTAVKWPVCSYFYCYHLSLTHIFLFFFFLPLLKGTQRAKAAPNVLVWALFSFSFWVECDFLLYFSGRKSLMDSKKDVFMTW